MLHCANGPNYEALLYLFHVLIKFGVKPYTLTLLIYLIDLGDAMNPQCYLPLLS